MLQGTAEVEPVTQKSPRGRNARVAARAKEAEEMAATLVQSFDAITQTVIDQNAGISPLEYALIQPALAKIFETTEHYSNLANVANPFFLLAGCGLWGIRVYTLWKQKHPSKPKQPKIEVPPNFQQARNAATPTPDKIEPNINGVVYHPQPAEQPTIEPIFK